MGRTVTLAVSALLAAACGGAHACPDPDALGHIAFRNGTLTVRIADEPDERARGLMGVTDLPANEGMAFTFGHAQDASFWMKDTPIPLSIAFVRGGRVVSITEMEPCTDDPCPTYASSDRYTLAIEANAGWFARHDVAVGDRMESFDGPVCE